MVYFFKEHEWEIYPLDFNTPFRIGEGIKLDKFIETIKVDPDFKWINKIGDKNE